MTINLTTLISIVSYSIHAHIPVSTPSVSAQWHLPATSWAMLWPPLRRSFPRRQHRRRQRRAPQTAGPRRRGRRCNWRRGCNCQPRRICRAPFYRCQPAGLLKRIAVGKSGIGNMETAEILLFRSFQRSFKMLDSCLDRQTGTIRHCMSAPLESGVLQCHGHRCIRPLWCSVPAQSICKELS